MKLLLLLALAFSPLALAAQPAPVEHLLPLYDQAFRHFAETVSPEPMKKAPIDWSSYPKAKRYRTRITQEYTRATKPNFAGRFIIPPDIGCGTSCAVVFVIDPATGKIYKPSVYAGVEFRADSSLIVFSPLFNTVDTPEDCRKSPFGPPILFHFDGKAFRKVPVKDCRPEIGS